MAEENPAGEGGQTPSEQQLHEQLEEEIRKVQVSDLVLQSAVSILNLAARRIAKDDERDLAQGRLGIDAARALVDLVPGDAQAQLRQAISELQLLYAKQTEGAGEPRKGGEKPDRKPPKGEQPKRDSGLWTPPGT